MPERIDLRTTIMLRRIVRLGGLLAILLGFVVTSDWIITLHLPDNVPLHIQMAPPTALGLVLSGASLLLLQAGSVRAARAAAFILLVCAVTVLGFQLLLHADPLTAWMAGSHRPLRHGHLVRVAGATALSFALFAVGMLCMASRWRRRRLMLMVASISGLVLTGPIVLCYAYNVEPRSVDDFYLGMSPYVAVGLFLLFLISLFIEPERGWLASLMSGRSSAKASRGQILLVITIPLLAGFLLLREERAGVAPPGLAMACMVICTIVPLTLQILRDGRMLGLLETRRLEAVAAERLLGDELGRMHDRTATLERSEAQLRGFMDRAVDGLALIRLERDGGLSVEMASPSLMELYGTVVQPVRLPQQAAQMLPAAVMEDLRRHIAICLETGGPYRYRARCATQDGDRVLDVILAPISTDKPAPSLSGDILAPIPRGTRTPGPGHAGTPVPGHGAEQLFAASVRDVTDDELREDQLRQSQKMEAVGQLTGGLAHDFNNLLAGLSGSLEMIQARLAQRRTDGIERYLDTAQEAAHRAAALTHRLLAFSRRQTLDPRPIEIDRIIAGMEELIRRTMGPEVTVIVQPSRIATTSVIDANQFENALLNLCLNARDAMPDGGRLTITTFDDVVTPETASADFPAGEYVRVRVADTGVGMSPDLVARAFDPFFTTKPIGQGTGLGLSMIYGFAKQSGGRVELLSEPGRGTFVDLQLPRQSDAAAAASAPVATVTEPAAGDGRTVLVVDDEPAIRMLVCDILAENGYRVLEAEDGAGGLRVLRSAETIDLLVTDVGLPNGMNGRQLADAARMLRRDLKVLFITGYVGTSALGDGVLEPGMEVLTKPFTLTRLMDRVDALAAPARTNAAPA